MAEFKRVDFQQVYSFEAYHGLSGSESALELHVGDVISHNAETDEIAYLSDAGEAISAKDDGKELYIVAQGDDVTLKLGTGYKSYKISDKVAVPSVSTAKTIIAGYRVDNLDNVIF